MSSFKITFLAHGTGCVKCLNVSESAMTMARVTGSVGSSYDDGKGHTATVKRES